MPILYDLLPEETRARYDIASLQPKAQRLLLTKVPDGYPPERAAALGAAISQRLQKFARPDPAAPERFPVAPPSGRYGAPAEVRVTPEGKYAPVTLAQQWDESPSLYRHAMLAADRLLRAMPGTQPIPHDGPVGEPRGVTERAAGVAGGIAGFAGTATALSPVLGPLALGGAAAAPAGTPKERLVRGAVAQTAGALGHVAGGAVGKVIPGMAGRAAATVPSALAFGSAAPVAESAIMRADIPGIGLHGDPGYPMPTIDDIIQGGGEMAVANLILGGRGILRGGRAKAAPSPIERPEVLSLPAGKIPPGRRLPASSSSAEVIEAGPGAAPVPATEAPVSRQLPPGPSPSGPAIELPRRLDRGEWIANRFPGALEKLAPELASDSRLVGGGNAVSDLFRAAVAKRLGGVEPQAATRADVKAAVRAVLASGEMRGYADIADAVNEPRGVRVPTDVRQREARFSQELTRRAGGREVLVDLPGGPARAVVVSVNAFRYPGVADPIRVVVADPGTGQIRVLRYGSLPDMTAALNSPQALRKAEDVFARNERQRAQRAARTAPPEKPVAGTGPGAPAPREAEPPRAPATAPARPAQGTAARGALDLFGLRQESTPKPAATAKPEAPREVEKPVPQARVEAPAVAAAAPAAPPEAPARPRVVIDLPVRDAKSAERLVAGINRSNPDIEARIEMRGNRVIITGNADAKEVVRPKAEAPAPERARPKGEPAAAPASPEPKPAPPTSSPADPIRYDPSTDRYSGGGLKNNDLLTDGKDVFRVTRRSGFTLELDIRTPAGWKATESRSVDQTSPEFRGDLRRYTEGPAGSQGGDRGGAAEVKGSASAPPAGKPAGKPLEQERLAGTGGTEVRRDAIRGTGEERGAVLDMGGEAKSFDEWFQEHMRRGETPASAASLAERSSGQKRPADFDLDAADKAAKRRALKDAGQGDLLSAAEPPVEAKPAKGRKPFERNERVSVPNIGRGAAVRVRGKVVGYFDDAGGKRMVEVAVPRGDKGNIHIEHHDPKLVLRTPKRGGNEETRAKKAANEEAYRSKLSERAGGSVLRAIEISREANDLKDLREQEAKDLPSPLDTRNMGEREARGKARDKAMRAFAAASRQAESAERVAYQIVAEHFTDHADPLSPNTRRAIALPEYADAWIEAKGKHKGLVDAPENHDTYFRAVEEAHVGSTREASELLRYAAERAGGKVRDALPALRGLRYLEQQRAFEEQAKSEGIPDFMIDDAGVSSAIRKALDTLPPIEAAKEIDRILDDRGPGDDIPAGTVPNVPEGFAEAARNLGGESGKVNIDLLLPHVWIRELRNIARAAKAQRRAMPMKDRVIPIVDANGNVTGRHEHGILERDMYAESSWTRFLASVARMEPGGNIIPPEAHTHLKIAQSDQARFEGKWNMEWVNRLGDAARLLAPHSKASMMVADAMEGSLPINKLPKNLQHVPEVVRGIFRDMLTEVNDRRKALGLPPIKGIEKYTPHIVLGRVADAMGQDLRRVWTDKHATEADINEMKSRFLFQREGDPEYVRDTAFQFIEYTNAVGRHLAHLEYWQVAEREMAKMEAGLVDRGPERRAAWVNWMKATMMRKKNFAERWMDKQNRLVLFAKGSADLREISEAAADRVPGLLLSFGGMAELKKQGWERAFMAGPNTKFRVGLGKEFLEAGRTPDGERLILTKGHNLFVMDPEIRSWVEKSARKRARASVASDAALERTARKLGSKPGEFLNDAFTPEQHAAMREAEWRAKVLRGQYSLFDSVFRGMGNMQSRALLGWNLRSILSNSLQMYLTMAPEIGYWRTTKAAGKMLSRPAAHTVARILEARGAITPEHANKIRQGFPIGRRTAQMVGALQGEVQRTHELTSDERSAVKMVYDALGPMAGFKAAEDFTRGTTMLGAAYLADRMGYPPEVASRFAKENTPEFYAEWGDRIAAARKSGTRENLYALMDSRWGFDYNSLGQSPIFGGAIGGLFGRMMTFTGGYTRKFVTAPVGAVGKVGLAIGRGIADRTTGGAFSSLLKPKRRGGTYGKYPAPANEFARWLDDYGAKWHDRHGARVLFREIQGLGMLAGIAAATKLSTAIVGTPGWQHLPLLLIYSMMPQGSPEKKKAGEIMMDFERSAIGDPARGVEGTMSPVMANIWKGIEEIPRAKRRADLAAKKGDTWGVVKAQATPLFVVLRAQGETSAIPGLVAIRRGFQEMPHAERFFETPAGRAFAHLMGIKSYIRGNGIVETIKGNLGLRPVIEQERNRVQIDRKRSSGRPQRPSATRRQPRALSFLEQRPQGGVA